jgi:hypothetical protein
VKKEKDKNNNILGQTVKLKDNVKNKIFSICMLNEWIGWRDSMGHPKYINRYVLAHIISNPQNLPFSFIF